MCYIQNYSNDIVKTFDFVNSITNYINEIDLIKRQYKYLL